MFLKIFFRTTRRTTNFEFIAILWQLAYAPSLTPPQRYCIQLAKLYFNKKFLDNRLLRTATMMRPLRLPIWRSNWDKD